VRLTESSNRAASADLHCHSLYLLLWLAKIKISSQSIKPVPLLIFSFTNVLNVLSVPQTRNGRDRCVAIVETRSRLVLFEETSPRRLIFAVKSIFANTGESVIIRH